MNNIQAELNAKYTHTRTQRSLGSFEPKTTHPSDEKGVDGEEKEDVAYIIH